MTDELKTLIIEVDELVANLELENKMLRARNERLTKQELFNDDLIRRQTERIVDMEDQIRNLIGEE